MDIGVALALWIAFGLGLTACALATLVYVLVRQRGPRA